MRNTISRTHQWGTGVDVGGLQTSREAIVTAGLDWKVDKQDTYWLKAGNIALMPNTYAMVRRDTQALLGRVGSGYETFQNREAFGFFDELVGEGRAIYDGAGSFNDGRRVWVSARLNEEDFRESSDKRGHYVVLINSFNGNSSIIMQTLMTRFFCMNQIKGGQFRVRHTGHMKDKVNDARAALGIITEEMRELDKCLEEIRRIRMTEKEVTDFAYVVGSTDYDRAAIQDLFKNGIGCEGKTRADAFNAVTELTTHHMRSVGSSEKQAERRLSGVMAGRGAQLQARAMEALLS